MCSGSGPWRAPGCYTPHCPKGSAPWRAPGCSTPHWSKAGHPTGTPGAPIMLAAKAALWPLSFLPQQQQTRGLSTAPAASPVGPFSDQMLLCQLWLSSDTCHPLPVSSSTSLHSTYSPFPSFPFELLMASIYISIIIIIVFITLYIFPTSFPIYTS